MSDDDETLQDGIAQGFGAGGDVSDGAGDEALLPSDNSVFQRTLVRHVIAVLVCDGPALDEAAIRPHLDTALARFKHPRRVEVLDALPRNAMGKVQKGVLRDRYASTG